MNVKNSLRREKMNILCIAVCLLGSLLAALAGCGQPVATTPNAAKGPTLVNKAEPPLPTGTGSSGPPGAPIVSTISPPPESNVPVQASESEIDPRIVGKVKEASARTPVRPLPKEQDVSKSFSRSEVRAEFWERLFLDGFRSGKAGGNSDPAAEEFLKVYCVRISESLNPPDEGKLSELGLKLLEAEPTNPHLQLALAAVLFETQADSPKFDAMFKSLEELLTGNKYSPWLSARFHRLKATILSRSPVTSKQARLEQMKLMQDDLLRAAADPKLTNLQRRMLVHLMKGWRAEFSTGEYQRELFAKLETAKGIDPWVREILLARGENVLAWQARGEGGGGSLSQEQAQGFRSHMAMSRQHALRAWDSHPELPEAALEMLNITMGNKGVADESVRFWFDEAVQADFIFTDAYLSLLWALRPRWRGSHRHMMAFGQECLATERFDTEVPAVFHNAMHDVAEEIRDWKKVLREPGAFEGYVRLFAAFEKRAPDESLKKLQRSRMAAAAYLAGKKVTARRALRELGAAADPAGFQLFGVSLSEVRVALEARTNSRAPFLADQKPATAAVLLPSGKYIVLGNEQGELSVWDVASHKQLQQLPKEHEAEIVSLQAAQGGKLLISASVDGVIALWNIENWQSKGSVSIPGRIHALSTSPDGTRVGISLAVKDKEELVVFDIAAKQPISRLAAASPVEFLALAADSRQVLYSSAAQGRAQLVAWTVSDPSVQPRSSKLKGEMTAWQSSSDGQRLAVGFVRPDVVLGERRNSYGLALLNPESGEVMTEVGRLPGRVTSVAMHPDGEQVVATSEDGSLLIWQPVGGGKLYSIRASLDGLTSLSMPVSNLAVALDSDGILQAWPMEKPLTGWTVESPLLESPWGGFVRSLSFTPDGKQLIVDNPVNELSLWDYAGGFKTCQMAFRTTRLTHHISLFPDHRRALISEAPANAVLYRIVDLVTGEMLEELPSVSRGIVSPSGKLFVLGGRGNVMIYDTEKIQPFAWGTFTVGNKNIRPAFSSDGKVMLTYDQAGPLKLWDMPDQLGPDTKSPSIRLSIPGVNPNPDNLSISDDKSLIAVGQNEVQVFGTDGKLRYALPLRYAAFSPDSQRIVAAGGPRNQNVAVICDAHSGEVKMQLRGHSIAFSAVTFTPDGRYILTGDRAGAVQAWDADSGQRLRQLP